jgi:formylglycine-generating enzyme required for sulfatase activity
MRFVLIPKGSFSMGSPPDEDGRSDDEQQHEVSLSRDFYLGMHEVTQSQYEKVMEENLSYFQGTQVLGEDTSRHPVDSVSWEDAIEFCRRLAELPEEKKANHKYRLPTEAEWEYACRAKSRTPTKFSFGIYDAQLGTYAWYASNSGKMTHTIGVKLPNKFGLYDMHGNVWEWCSDWYDDKYYANSPGADPRGPDSGSSRVLRGGSWYDVPLYVRCACRNRATPAHRDRNNGFRVVLE